jgi:hypothetical protein
VTHSAIKGQSLLQSGSDGWPGQQGIWSIASAVAVSPAAARSMATGVSIAIAGRAIGASRTPATAKAVPGLFESVGFPASSE